VVEQVERFGDEVKLSVFFHFEIFQKSQIELNVI